MAGDLSGIDAVGVNVSPPDVPPDAHREPPTPRNQRERHPDVDLIIAFIVALRMRRGMSQLAMAEQIGHTCQAWVSELETGVIVSPRADSLARLLSSFGLRLSIRIDHDVVDEDVADDLIQLAYELNERGIYFPLWAA